jgi:hypothetical protein
MSSSLVQRPMLVVIVDEGAGAASLGGSPLASIVTLDSFHLEWRLRMAR